MNIVIKTNDDLVRDYPNDFLSDNSLKVLLHTEYMSSGNRTYKKVNSKYDLDTNTLYIYVKQIP